MKIKKVAVEYNDVYEFEDGDVVTSIGMGSYPWAGVRTGGVWHQTDRNYTSTLDDADVERKIKNKTYVYLGNEYLPDRLARGLDPTG